MRVRRRAERVNARTEGHQCHAEGDCDEGPRGGSLTGQVEVSLTPDAITRVGLKTAVVRQSPVGESLPATIMPSA